MLLFDLALSANLRQFGIKFRSDQHGKAGPIEPRHQWQPRDEAGRDGGPYPLGRAGLAIGICSGRN
jgi:hypothetical protein